MKCNFCGLEGLTFREDVGIRGCIWNPSLEQPHYMIGTPPTCSSKQKQEEKKPEVIGVDMKEYHKNMENWFCSKCGQTYNTYKLRQCPSCYKEVCRTCGNLRVPLFTNQKCVCGDPMDYVAALVLND